ncbi:MAG: hypothetical protein AB1295_06240 [Candidatus Micrarchaeota archaeon]
MSGASHPPSASIGRLLFASLIIIFLIAAGCTLKKPVSVGCCVLNDPLSPSPQCTELQGKDAQTELISTQSCNVTGGYCDITIEVTLADATSTSQLTVPICGEATSPCISSDCIAQVCGSLTYNPVPVPSARDAAGFEEEAGETGSVGAIDETRASTPTGLYGATCTLQRSDQTLTNYLQNSKGSFVNTFRFGVGDTFEEFDHYRWLFPISDIYCNANPVAGTKDRYMNYLLSPDEFEDKVDGASYDDPAEKVSSAGFCLQGEESPFLGETYDGADFADYRYYPVGRTTSPYSYMEESVLDREFYSNFLTLIYSDELTAGLSSFSTLPEPAPFECSSSLDCASSFCNKQTYNRMLCKDTSSGEWVLCGCDSAGKSCNGQSTEVDYLGPSAPDDAAELLNHLSGYNSGERYYAVTQLPVGIVDISVNPTCTAGNSIKGIDWIEVQARPPLDIMKFVDGGAVTPTADQLTQLEDCEDDGNWTPCESLVNALFSDIRPDIVLPGEVEESDKYPNDIKFFGDYTQVETNGVPAGTFIGYSLLSEPRFKQTDFYKACHPHYKIINATKTYSGGSSDPTNPGTGGDHNNQGAKDAVRSAKLFVPPEPIPDYIGTGWKPYDTKIQCHTTNDDEGHYRYVPRYILIQDAGSCELDPATVTPVTASFGWCEPCSYSTLAKQTVGTKASYSPNQRRVYSSFTYSTLKSSQICDTSAPTVTPPDADPQTEVPDTDLYCPTTDAPENPYGAYDYLSFNATPDSVYLQEKQAQYLKESVMPVIDLTGPTNWDVFGRLRLANTIIGRGPSILVIQNLSVGTPFNIAILTRIDTAKAACPSCLIAVEFANNGTPFAMNASKRLDENLRLADLLDPETTPGLLERLDMIAISFYPNEYTGERTGLCTADEVERNEAVFAFLENQSRSIMNLTKLPVMVTDFGMRLDGCWDQTKAKQFISYLFLKQKRLSRIGMAGIIFTNVSILTNSAGDHQPMFCSLEKGSRNMAADEPATLYTKIYATPADQALCSACSEFDIVAGLCDKTCANGAECTVDVDSLSLAKTQLGLPESTPDSEVPMKCPDQILPEPCTPCSEMSEQIQCEFYRSDGTVESATYDIDGLTVLEGDILSSIPEPYACCLSDEGGNYTFSKQTSMGKITAPLLYSPSGDPRQDCGIADVSALEQPLCDVPLPIKNHKVECTILP